ncbi:hypothetical protein GQ600_2581 [Phytophthora cactorum]|nr:hypothetical protein GQ600_2581 [Phytophthora cactorum]
MGCIMKLVLKAVSKDDPYGL